MESRLDRIEKALELFIQENREFQRKTGEFIERLGERIKEIDERLSQKMDRVSKELGEMGITQGQIAEDLFYRNVEYLFVKQDMIFSDIRRNVKKKGIAEYDIVASNKDKVLVIEVKNKLEKRSVDKFIEKGLRKNFKAKSFC